MARSMRLAWIAKMSSRDMNMNMNMSPQIPQAYSHVFQPRVRLYFSTVLFQSIQFIPFRSTSYFTGTKVTRNTREEPRYAQFIGYGYVSPHYLGETRYPSLWILMQGSNPFFETGNVIGGGHGPHSILILVRAGNIDASYTMLGTNMMVLNHVLSTTEHPSFPIPRISALITLVSI